MKDRQLELEKLEVIQRFVSVLERDVTKILPGGYRELMLALDVPLCQDIFSKDFMEAVVAMKCITSKLLTYKEMLRDASARSIVLREMQDADHRQGCQVPL